MTEASKYESVDAALAAFQATATPVPKSDTGQTGNQRYSYASLASVLDHVRDQFARCGLGWSSELVWNERGVWALDVHIVHASSDTSRTLRWPVNDFDGDQKSFQAQVTYARRGAFMALAGLIGVDEDDGEDERGTSFRNRQAAAGRGRQEPRPEAGKAPGKATSSQLNMLWAKAQKRSEELGVPGIDAQAILAHMKGAVGIDSGSDLLKADVDRAIKLVDGFEAPDTQPEPDEEPGEYDPVPVSDEQLDAEGF